MILIYGASGHGREAANLAKVCGYSVAGFIDDFQKGDSIYTLETAKQKYPDAELVLGVGYPQVRRKVFDKVINSGFCVLRNLIHPQVFVSESVVMDSGVMVSPGVCLTVNIQLGKQVHVNLGCTLSHDVHIGDFVTLSPGVHVCGNVNIESDVFVGAGAVIMNNIVIGQGAVIGAGACVTKSVPAGETWVGVPAKPMVRKI